MPVLSEFDITTIQSFVSANFCPSDAHFDIAQKIIESTKFNEYNHVFSTSKLGIDKLACRFSALYRSVKQTIKNADEQATQTLLIAKIVSAPNRRLWRSSQLPT